LLSTAPKEADGCILTDPGRPKMEIPGNTLNGPLPTANAS